MQRSPETRHAAHHRRSPHGQRAPKPGRTARFRWLMALWVVFLAVLGTGLALYLEHQSPSDAARKTAATQPVSSSGTALAAPAPDTLRQRSIGPSSAPHALAPSTAASQARSQAASQAASSSPSQTAAPTSAPTHSAALTPTATAEYQTPRGANELAWSEAILTKLGAPLTDANIESIGYWMQNEAGSPPSGIVGANNPINVSQPGYGGTPIRSEGGGYYLYSYPNATDGVGATATYLNRPSYSGIMAALKAGSGLSSSSLGSEFSVYSGGGYTTVPDTWGASQGQPET